MSSVNVPASASAAIDADTRRTAELFLTAVGRHYNVSRAVLFGSRARRDHRPDSDVDIAVFLRGPPTAFLPTKLAMADMAFDVLLETGMRVQPLPVWEIEWQRPDRYSNPALLRAIARQGLEL
jgi:predicted nucleotidyltransferase